MKPRSMTMMGFAVTSLVLLGGCTSDDGSDPSADDADSTGDGSTSDADGETGGPGAETEGSDGRDDGDDDADDGNGDDGGETSEQGFVFSLSNAADGNEVIVFERDAEGKLERVGEWPTAGRGTGLGLGSQGALVLSPDARYLYAVNAGSNQISAFEVYDDHLALVSVEDSGGVHPTSVTASDSLVYVLNAGGEDAAGGVVGFAAENGRLTRIDSAVQSLSDAQVSTAPAQIGLSPDGNALIVTERATNDLLTYWVAPDGSLSAPDIASSEGETPFGFAFRANPGTPATLVVSEAFGGAAGASAVSSYALGGVDPAAISSSVPNDQTAACWLVIARGRFAYTANTPSNSISGYHLTEDGALELFDDGGVTAFIGANNRPLDMALGGDDEFLYVLNGESGTIRGFTVEADGTLSSLGDGVPVPETSFGLAAR